MDQFFFWLYQALPGLTGLDSPEPVGALERWSVGLIALIELIELIRLIGSLQVCCARGPGGQPVSHNFDDASLNHCKLVQSSAMARLF